MMDRVEFVVSHTEKLKKAATNPHKRFETILIERCKFFGKWGTYPDGTHYFQADGGSIQTTKIVNSYIKFMEIETNKHEVSRTTYPSKDIDETFTMHFYGEGEECQKEQL